MATKMTGKPPVLSYRTLKGTTILGTLVLDFSPPKLWDYKLMLFKPPSLGYLVTLDTGRTDHSHSPAGSTLEMTHLHIQPQLQVPQTQPKDSAPFAWDFLKSIQPAFCSGACLQQQHLRAGCLGHPWMVSVCNNIRTVTHTQGVETLPTSCQLLLPEILRELMDALGHHHQVSNNASWRIGSTLTAESRTDFPRGRTRLADLRVICPPHTAGSPLCLLLSEHAHL